jgi:hypothetical protein
MDMRKSLLHIRIGKKAEAKMTASKTAKRPAARKVAETAESDPQNVAGWTFTAPRKVRGWKSAGTVSLDRTETFEPSDGWHRTMRALWNMGDAAETATGGNAYYARRRDAILSRLIRFVG